MTQQQEQGLTASRRPGQMTAVMQAVASQEPRVLRIGVVRRGRVVEERILKPGVGVTVGTSARNLFVVTAGALGSFQLLEQTRGQYVLNVLPGMTGRLALPSGICDLELLRGQADCGSDGVHRVPLTDSARGKVVVGETTFLFQFVAPLPLQPRPQLPLAVTQGSTSIDWTTTVVAALAFMVHFTAIGFIYSDWLDPVVDSEHRVQGVVEAVATLPKPPAIEDPLDVDQPELTPEKKTASRQNAPAAKGQPAGNGGSKKGPMSRSEKAGLTAEVERLELAMVAALGEGPATSEVLAEGEVAHDALDRAAASDKSVGLSRELSLPGGRNTVVPGASAAQLAELGNKGKTGKRGSGKARKVGGPPATAVGSPAVAGGTVTNASAVVAGMRPGFRRCYTIELSTNPDAQGTIQLSIRVGPGGEVQGVSASPSGNLSGTAVSCVRSRASAANFSPPVGGAALIRVPVTFMKQRR